MVTVDITPSPRVLRMLGQIDFAPWQCLAELIDNSIDAFIDQNRLCCANALKDSLRESSLLVQLHEQTQAPHLPHHELA